MPVQLKQIVVFCAGRYNALNRLPDCDPARAFMDIINQANEFRMSSLDPERDLLDYLSKPYSNADLVKACKEVLEHIGAAPGN